MGSHTLFHKVTIMMLGISSLIGWNAVLNSFAFFIEKFDSTVPFLFPIPLLFANFLWGPVIPYLADRIPLFKRIFFGLLGVSIMLILLPIIALSFPKGVGYAVCLVCNFMIGSFNSLSQNSMIGLVSTLGGELISIYWIATGVSGLSMNICQMMAYGIFGFKMKNAALFGTLFYFAMACLISAATVICLKKVIANHDLIDETGSLLNKGETGSHLMKDEEFAKMSAYTDQQDTKHNMVIIEEYEQKETFFQELKRKITMGILIARSIPVLIWVIYVETFLMFPGVTLMKQWNNSFLAAENGAWGALVIVTFYNLGDIAGKQITYWRKTFNYNYAVIVIAGRVAFFFVLLLIASKTDYGYLIESDWFAILISFLFAVTNGYSTAALMTIGPELTEDPKKKEIIGFINSFGLTFGISCGTFGALAFKNANKWSF